MIVRKTLEDVWDQQFLYNERIKLLQKRTSSEWMINYILGTMSELSELLEQLNWKTHRTPSMEEAGPNIPEELADITKYVFSMWQLAGYSSSEMCDFLLMKGEMLNQIFEQENKPLTYDQKVLMLDLDGVVADFRAGFMEWLQESPWSSLLLDSSNKIGLHLDITNGWLYSEYEEAKLAFELQGGYNKLPRMSNICAAVNVLSHLGWHVIVYTARPYKAYKRIWRDTWVWLQSNHIRVNELHFGYAERVLAASKQKRRNLVVAFEDDPTLIQRYASSKIPVLAISQPYNEHIPESKYIKRVEMGDAAWRVQSLVTDILIEEEK